MLRVLLAAGDGRERLASVVHPCIWNDDCFSHTRALRESLNLTENRPTASRPMSQPVDGV
jgi:hypothetical protein